MSDNVETTRTIETQDQARALRSRKVEEAAEKVIDSAIDLGRIWARHGLSIGKLALETSATSLRTTAGLLGAIAEAFEQKAETNEPEAPEGGEHAAA